MEAHGGDSRRCSAALQSGRDAGGGPGPGAADADRDVSESAAGPLRRPDAAVFRITHGPFVAVRLRPSLDAPVLDTVPAGEMVEALAARGSWVQLARTRNGHGCSGRGGGGWMMTAHPTLGQLLSPIGAAVFEVAFSPSVVVRSAPELTAPPLGRRMAGSRLRVVGHVGGRWLKLATPEENSGAAPGVAPAAAAGGWLLARHPQHGLLVNYIAGVVPELPAPGGAEALNRCAGAAAAGDSKAPLVRPRLVGDGLAGTEFAPPLSEAAVAAAVQKLRQEVEREEKKARAAAAASAAALGRAVGAQARSASGFYIGGEPAD